MNSFDSQQSDKLDVISVAKLCENIVYARNGWLRNNCEVKKSLQLAIEQDFHCALCNREFIYASQAFARSIQLYTEDFRLATVDHIRPLAQGGKNEPSNCQIACRKCNTIKSHYSGDYAALLKTKLQKITDSLNYLAEYAEIHPASVRDKIRAQLGGFEFLKPELIQLKLDNLIDQELIEYCVRITKSKFDK